MFFVYILYSEKLKRYYVGFSENPQKRLQERHNEGGVKATANGIPYILQATKKFRTKHEVRKEELKIKKMKSRIYIEQLIKELKNN